MYHNQLQFLFYWPTSTELFRVRPDPSRSLKMEL